MSQGVMIQTPKANPTVKPNLVEEKIVMLTTSASFTSQTEAYKYGGSAGDIFEVRSGECVELIGMGVKSQANLESITIKNRDHTTWNTFYTAPDYGANALPFSQMVNFENRLTNWGFNSFKSRYVSDIVSDVLQGARPRSDLRLANIAPTLKLGEGDQIRVFANPSATVSSAVPIALIIRKYKKGYPVNYSAFDEYDGGLRSNKQYFEEHGKLTTSTANTWSEVYSKQVLKNEAYKFHQVGILSATNLVQAKISIDDRKVEKDRYYVAPTYNQLPFNDQYELNASYDPTETAVVTNVLDIQKMHRFKPTIDILKDHNEDITIDVMDGGSTASNLVCRIMGVRYILA